MARDLYGRAGLQIFNKEVPIGGNSPLKKSIALTRELHLKYNQNTLSFDFAFLRYNTPEMHDCMYKLDGLDKDWLHMKQQQKITYSNLSSGNYLLRIRSLYPGGEGCSLKIRISPPFWLSTYAYILYSLLIMLLVYGAFRISAKRIEERHRLSLE